MSIKILWPFLNWVASLLLSSSIYVSEVILIKYIVKISFKLKFTDFLWQTLSIRRSASLLIAFPISLFICTCYHSSQKVCSDYSIRSYEKLKWTSWQYFKNSIWEALPHCLMMKLENFYSFKPFCTNTTIVFGHLGILMAAFYFPLSPIYNEQKELNF